MSYAKNFTKVSPEKMFCNYCKHLGEIFDNHNEDKCQKLFTLCIYCGTNKHLKKYCTLDNVDEEAPIDEKTQFDKESSFDEEAPPLCSIIKNPLALYYRNKSYISKESIKNVRVRPWQPSDDINGHY